MRTSLALALALALLVATGAVSAQPEDARFRRGVELYQRGDYRGALVECEAVLATSSSPLVLYNLGRTLERLGRNADAVQRYGQFLDAGAPGMGGAARADLVAHVRELRTGLAELTIQGQPGLFWRTCPSDVLQGAVMAQNVIGVDLAITKLAVVYVSDS